MKISNEGMNESSNPKKKESGQKFSFSYFPIFSVQRESRIERESHKNEREFSPG
jgi:hypothetical protein